MIIEDVEHLDQPVEGGDPVDEVDLPPLVRCRRFEASPRRLRPLLRLRHHEPAAHQDPMHRRHRRHPTREPAITGRDATGSSSPHARDRRRRAACATRRPPPRHRPPPPAGTCAAAANAPRTRPPHSLPAALDVLVERLARDPHLPTHPGHVHRLTSNERHHRCHRLHRHHLPGHAQPWSPAPQLLPMLRHINCYRCTEIDAGGTQCSAQ